ncbi:hypothetical protein QCA50_015137 [Cerrena zonata]|uniref:Uncharacterized protein n=1 Tax=Cerrena zonata TaxID=2478898 RepID=A0AAW0FYD8_9APHY
MFPAFIALISKPAVIAGVAIATCLAPILALPVFGWIGFASVGPIAGSWAAAIQAMIGNVAAGSVFAAIQSAAMGGALPAFVYVVFGAIGGVVGYVASVLGLAATGASFVASCFTAVTGLASGWMAIALGFFL